ncbi:MAG TPA: hypothetical protein VHT24_05570 [Pseudacidobacterium sp.]|nr:hypothetical protein [Pseudacidobacterium sp.]
MSDQNIPPELAYRLHIWWDPIWTIMDKSGIAQQPEIVAAALDAQAQIHTIQANALNQMKEHVLKSAAKR